MMRCAAGIGQAGVVRVTLAAIRCEKGQPDVNLRRHEQVLAEAAARGSDLAVFPEMSLTGSVDPGPTRSAWSTMTIQRLVP
jgi:predicted amidohydrolase